jgi:hypothetical protein
VIAAAAVLTLTPPCASCDPIRCDHARTWWCAGCDRWETCDVRCLCLGDAPTGAPEDDPMTAGATPTPARSATS